MSNIFSALRKAEGDLAEISKAVLDGPQVADVAPSPATTAATAAATAAAPAPEPVPTPVPTVAPPPAVAPTPLAATNAAAPQTPVTPGHTVALRIPAGSPVLPFDGLDRQAAEEYRVIRTKILQHPGQPRIIACTSPGEHDGKTTTTINTAAAMALKSDTAVLLIEADLRRPRLAHFLGLPQTAGLADVIEGRCAPDAAIIQVEQAPNLYLLPAGNVRRNPSELLDSPAWRAVVKGLAERFDYIMIDTPPAGSVADYALVQAVCDGVVLVVRPDQTVRATMEHALALIPRPMLIGAILNCVDEWFLYRSRYYTEYGSPLH